MRSRWNLIAGQFNTLSKRERSMIGVALLMLLGAMLYFPLESQRLEYKSLQQQLSQLSAENATSQKQLALYQESLKQDPNESVRQRLVSLHQQMVAVDKELSFQMVDMVPAKHMPIMLKELLQRVKGVKLVGFETIAPAPFLRADKADKEERLNIYTHGMKLSFEGDYFATLALIKAIEAMPNKLYWKQLDYAVTAYPKANITLDLYTLSINKDFISVAH